MAIYKVTIWEKVVHEVYVNIEEGRLGVEEDEEREYAIDFAKEILAEDETCQRPECFALEHETWDFETTDCELWEEGK